MLKTLLAQTTLRRCVAVALLLPYAALAVLFADVVMDVLRWAENYLGLWGSEHGGWLYASKVRYLCVAALEFLWFASGICLCVRLWQSPRRAWLVLGHLGITMLYLAALSYFAQRLY